MTRRRRDPPRQPAARSPKRAREGRESVILACNTEQLSCHSCLYAPTEPASAAQCWQPLPRLDSECGHQCWQRSGQKGGFEHFPCHRLKTANTAKTGVCSVGTSIGSRSVLATLAETC